MIARMAAPSPHVLGIDPKMYRHFTALTLVISFSIAFIANGEQNRAMSEPGLPKVAKQETKGHAQRSELDVHNGASEDPSPVHMGGPSQPPPHPAAVDEPIDPVVTDDGQLTPKAGRFNFRRPPLRTDPALLARMTPDQRTGYLKALALQDQTAHTTQGPGGGAPGGSDSGAAGVPSQQQINRLVSASRARSGGGD